MRSAAYHAAPPGERRRAHRVLAEVLAAARYADQRAWHLASATVLAPLSADWNASHIFNEQWPSHARFHGVVGIGTPAALGSFALWRLWTNPGQASLARAIAAAIPISYWGSFFPALLVPGTGVDDPPHRVGRIAGVPINVFWATVTTASAIAGWLLDSRLRSTRTQTGYRAS